MVRWCLSYFSSASQTSPSLPVSMKVIQRSSGETRDGFRWRASRQTVRQEAGTLT
jgi:hypothetical protein